MLHLVKQQTPPPLPEIEHAYEPRRPGELHETVALEEAQALTLATAAAETGVGASTLLTVLIEAELLVETLRHLGRDTCCEELAREEAVPRRALSAAEGEYLRTLGIRRRRTSRTPSRSRVALPVRLISRLDADLLARALAGKPERALAWETRALLARRTLGEWGLERALAFADDAGS